MKKFNFILILVSLTLSSFSQERQNYVRLEIDIKYDVDNYYIVPIGKKGIIMFNPVLRSKDNSIKWVFTNYDTNFNENWSSEIEIPQYHSHIFHYYDTTSEAIYIFYSRKVGDKATDNFFIEKTYYVVKFNINERNFKYFQGNLEKEMVLTDFTVSNDAIWFGGYTVPSISNRNVRILGCYLGLGIPWFFGILKFYPQAILYKCSFKENKTELVQLPTSISSKIRNINYNKHNKFVEVLLELRKNKYSYEAHILQFNNQTELINTIIIPQELKFEVNKCKITNITNNKQLLIGTYTNQGKFKMSINDAENKNNEALGFFIGILEKSVFTYSKYLRFAEIFSGVDYKIKSKYADYSFYNKKLLGNTRYLLLHDIINYSGLYIIIAETYYPEYRRVCNPYFDYYGRYYEDCYYIFEGYRFTQAYITCIDSTGQILWNNSFEIGDIISNSLTEKIKVFFENDEIVLLYSNEGKIRSKTIKNKEISQETEVVPIETSLVGDEVKANYSSNIEYWYDKYFIAFGVQKIKNEKIADKKQKKHRTVLYLNKIQYN